MAKKISSPRVIGKGVFWNPRFQTNCRVIYISILIKSKCVSVSQSVSVGLGPRVELNPGREREREGREI